MNNPEVERPKSSTIPERECEPSAELASPLYLYKFVTLDTAIKIIKSVSLRFSSPFLFNDPFDGQCKLRCPFSDEEIIRRLFEIAVERHGENRILLPIRPLLEVINNEVSTHYIN